MVIRKERFSLSNNGEGMNCERIKVARYSSFGEKEKGCSVWTGARGDSSAVACPLRELQGTGFKIDKCIQI